MGDNMGMNQHVFDLKTASVVREFTAVLFVNCRWQPQSKTNHKQCVEIRRDWTKGCPLYGYLQYDMETSITKTETNIK